MPTDRVTPTKSTELASSDRFARSTLALLGSYAATTVLALAIGALVARAFGPAGTGTFVLLGLFGAIVGLAVNAGLGQAAVYYVGRDPNAFPAIAGNLLAITIVIGIPVSVLLAVGIPWYGDSLLSGAPPELILIACFMTVFTLGKLYAEYLFASVYDFTWVSLLNVIDVGVRFAVLLLGVAIGGGLRVAVIAMMIGSLVACVAGWIRIGRRAGPLRPRLQLSVLGRLGSYGARSYGTMLVAYLNLRLDQLLVGVLLPIRQVGVYAAAVAIAEIGQKLANVVAKVLFTSVASIPEDQAIGLTNRVARVTTTLGLATSAALAIIGPALLRGVFGGAFVADTTLRFLLPGTLFFNMSQILFSDLAGRGRPELGLLASGVSLGLTVAGNLLLTPRLGVEGAALSSSIAYIAGAVVLLLSYLKLTGERVGNVLWMTREDLWELRALSRRTAATLRSALWVSR